MLFKSAAGVEAITLKCDVQAGSSFHAALYWLPCHRKNRGHVQTHLAHTTESVNRVPFPCICSFFIHFLVSNCR
jgi:hypothetical protein